MKTLTNEEIAQRMLAYDDSTDPDPYDVPSLFATIIDLEEKLADLREQSSVKMACGHEQRHGTGDDYGHLICEICKIGRKARLDEANLWHDNYESDSNESWALRRLAILETPEG